MLSRIFELREKVQLFLVAKQKHDLLLAFGGDGFSTYLAYLADIFEALNHAWATYGPRAKSGSPRLLYPARQ